MNSFKLLQLKSFILGLLILKKRLFVLEFLQSNKFLIRLKYSVHLPKDFPTHFPKKLQFCLLTTFELLLITDSFLSSTRHIFMRKLLSNSSYLNFNFGDCSRVSNHIPLKNLNRIQHFSSIKIIMNISNL